MTNNNACLFTDSGICIFTGGKQYTVPNDHVNLEEIKTAIAEKRWEDLGSLTDVRESVSNWISADKDFELKNDMITFKGNPFSEKITSKVLAMMSAGHGAEPLYAFLRKVTDNPSKTAQDELLLFCEANKFMIHEDGDLIAYKGVRDDFFDIHSGTISNRVGKIVTMQRNTVDDNRNKTCSTGLHFASHNYASTWTTVGHVMVMKINPRDVVSIPSDYNNQKGRCCRYEVIAELTSKSEPLPMREVYTDKDLGTDEVSRLEAEIDRKKAVLAKWEADQKTSDSSGLRNAIAQIQDEIWVLEDRLDDLDDLGGDDDEEDLDDLDFGSRDDYWDRY